MATVKELRAELKALGLPTAGNKAALVERLAEALEAPPEAPVAPSGRSFQYIGAEGSNPRETTTLGYTFTLNGDPVEVDEFTAAKLAGNRHFRSA